MITWANMRIAVARSQAEIEVCHPVMKELRTQYDARTFIKRVQEQQKDGYLLAFVEDEGEVVAVAGFRLARNLAWGKFLYVDDLVTQPANRPRINERLVRSAAPRWAATASCGSGGW